MDNLLGMSEVASDKGGRTPWPEATWRYWRHRGYGPPAVRIGRRIFYREADIDRWIAEQFQGDGEPARESARD